MQNVNPQHSFHLNPGDSPYLRKCFISAAVTPQVSPVLVQLSDHLETEEMMSVWGLRTRSRQTGPSSGAVRGAEELTRMQICGSPPQQRLIPASRRASVWAKFGAVKTTATHRSYSGGLRAVISCFQSRKRQINSIFIPRSSPMWLANQGANTE